MKVCIPFRASDVGGSSVFAQKFTTELSRRSMVVTDDPAEPSDIVLVMSSAPPRAIRQARNQGAKIVQRLDGVYYYRVRGPLYPLANYRMKVIHQRLADFVIYQSQFSQELCVRFLGQTAAPSTLIYNGVDTETFSPNGQHRKVRLGSNQHVLFTVSAFRRRDMLLPLLQSMDVLSQRRSDMLLLVAGTVAPKLEPLVKPYRQRSDIRFLGQVTNAELPQYERAADAFVFSDISACPNVVIEALACGLPVVCFNRGGTPELLDIACSRVVAHSPHELWRLRPFNTQAFASAIEDVIQHRDTMAAAARRRALEYYTLTHMVDQYIKVFQDIR